MNLCTPENSRSVFLKKLQQQFLIIVFLSIVILNGVYAQNMNTSKNVFQNEIDAFEKMDQIAKPLQHSILFVGSSSFRLWTKINESFPGYPIINRGFGGSTLLDMIHFDKETIYKYNPKQIYIYCGENDIAASDTVTPEIVLNRFITLFQLIRKNLSPNIPIEFISIKPSVARWNMESRMVAANSLIKSYLSKQKNANFIDVHTAMLDHNGMVYKDIFINDNLHLNAKGYAIWKKLIDPTLLKN